MTAKNSILVNGRASGILMPIFSLESPYGIGGLGKWAYKFVDFLAKAGQKYWQILPIGHTGYGNSPYQTYSTVAGNPYFVDLEVLKQEGLLTEADLAKVKSENRGRIDYDMLYNSRHKILWKAYKKAMSKKEIKGKIKKFHEENSDWIEDYSIFMALRDYFNKPLWEWDISLKRREKSIMNKYKQELKEEIQFYVFIQAMFFDQWSKLKQYANSKGIQIIGDVPIYPSPDSVDIWVNSQLFKVDEELKPTEIAGVPPDYYCPDGQVWGNPVYDWDEHRKEAYKWWINRIKNAMKIADVIRIDHFRGLKSFWSIPAGEKTAAAGRWLPGPEMDLFSAIKNELEDIPIIAEDLGIITDDVREFLSQTGYPGMRVMVFGLYEDDDNLHLPHNYPRNCIAYTSTHDSETITQMILEQLSQKDKKFALEYINASEDEPIGISAIRTIYASPAVVAIVPMQDILSLGVEGRMNTPATVGVHNWSWRLQQGLLTDELAEILYKLAKTYKRV